MRSKENIAAKVQYMYQLNYGYCDAYFIAVIIALFIVKRLIYYFTDRNSLMRM